MNVIYWLFVAMGGLLSGFLARLIGIGGGIVLVPILIALNHTYVQSVATSNFALAMIAFYRILQNWQMGYFKFERVTWTGLPSIFTALIGAYFVTITPEPFLKVGFGIFLLTNIYLIQLRQQLAIISEINLLQESRTLGWITASVITELKLKAIQLPENIEIKKIDSTIPLISIGGSSGLLSGLFGVGGGIIITPLRMLLLNEKTKVAIKNSICLIFFASVGACLQHLPKGNVLFFQGIILGTTAIIVIRLSNVNLPKLSEQRAISISNSLLVILTIYVFIQAIFF